jgi:2-polyprenyl-6-methoxyphenol hydroxylase-like FAD-dependent oxidoreductase
MAAGSDYAYTHDYDVLIAGAGVAGVAAALSAARAGRSVALVEKTVLLGGLATSGLINHYLPICDGNGHQVVFGIAEEFLRLSIRYGPGSVPPGWRGERDADEQLRYRTLFSPASFVLALDEAVEEAGIDLWLDALVCQPVIRAGRIEGLELETKSGRGMLTARVIVDATGDADVAFRSGAPCAELGNLLSLWAIGYSAERARQSVESGSGEPFLRTVRVGADAFGAGQPTDVPPLHGTDARQVTAFVVDSRRRLRARYQAATDQRGERARLEEFPLTLPSMAQFRMTRRIEGVCTMRDGESPRRRDDSVGLVADWRTPGPVWEVPYGCLLPRDVRGLLVAGRCISSDGDAWEVMRVIPPAALTGQAAGVAAAIAVECDTTPDALDPRDVQRRLRAAGVRLHPDEIGL